MAALAPQVGGLVGPWRVIDRLIAWDDEDQGWSLDVWAIIKRMDHVGIVVYDLGAATEFFVELGLELQGEGTVKGRWVDRIVGLDGVRAEIAMLQTPDGHGRLELSKFHAPATHGGDRHATANTPGIRHVAFAVDDIDAVVAGLRARGAELVGEVEDYKDIYRLCYVRGPEGIIVELAEQIGSGAADTRTRPQLLFVQGGGQGAHDEWDNKLVKASDANLGRAIEIQYPQMPSEDDPNYALWRTTLERELRSLGDSPILVAHSVGGTILLGVLAEHAPARKLGAIFLIAAPFAGDGGWSSDDLQFHSDLRARLPSWRPYPLLSRA